MSKLESKATAVVLKIFTFCSFLSLRLVQRDMIIRGYLASSIQSNRTLPMAKRFRMVQIWRRQRG